MIVYKVVKNEDGILLSSRIYDKNLVVTYTPKVNTKPRVGRILAFTSLEDAKDFSYPDTEEIWKCYTRRVIPCSWVIRFRRDLTPESCTDFWKNKPMEYEIMKAPYGSVSCSSIMLVKRVL